MWGVPCQNAVIFQSRIGYKKISPAIRSTERPTDLTPKSHAEILPVRHRKRGFLWQKKL